MGLILDTSALVAWERAHHAGKQIRMNAEEELEGRGQAGNCDWRHPCFCHSSIERNGKMEIHARHDGREGRTFADPGSRKKLKN